MRVISKKTLKDFYDQELYKDSKSSLESWHKEAIKADYKAKNKVKKLTQDERITRIELILGIETESEVTK